MKKISYPGRKNKIFLQATYNFMQENPRLPSFILNEINRNPARIKKLLKNVDFKKFWETLEEQHRDELEKYNITKESLPQIMYNNCCNQCFPFAARAILEGIFENLGSTSIIILKREKNLQQNLY